MTQVAGFVAVFAVAGGTVAFVATQAKQAAKAQAEFWAAVAAKGTAPFQGFA
jgi:hypothetical protein